jgi:23S rRNA pseudouridine1911/1915/1917 synthase
MAKELIVDEETKGKRLDVTALSLLPTLSRAFVQRLIDERRITVNGQQEKSGYRLRSTDKITIDFELEDIEKIEDIELPILYQDDDIVVINKPVGVISHSRGRYWYEPSVASFLRQITSQEGDRAGIVHRLDRATSGVMICAKNSETLSFLQKQFSTRNVKKMYTAIVTGKMDPPEAVIDMPIERNPKEPATFRVGSNGKPAQTHYKVIKSTDTYSLLELRPVTGRTHQLRVHLKHVKHSIVGDRLYGGKEAPRLFLHATSLEITLPGGERKVFSADLPKEFNELLG